MPDIKQLAVDASNEALTSAIKTTIGVLTNIWIQTTSEEDRKKARDDHRRALQIHKDVHAESLAAIQDVFG